MWKVYEEAASPMLKSSYSAEYHRSLLDAFNSTLEGRGGGGGLGVFGGFGGFFGDF